MEKRNVRENKYHCPNCPYVFSFLTEEIKVGEIKTVIPKAGSGTERSQRSRKKNNKKGLSNKGNF
jgi:hypothetical protein